MNDVLSAANAPKQAAGAGLRQSMAWLHTWCGLWFSWLLYAVFLTGTLAVFEDPISHWMTPEHHAEEAALEAASAAAVTGTAGADRGQRLARAVAYMAQHHATQDMWEIWPADANGGGELRAYWFDAERRYVMARLDPATGAPLPDAAPAVPVRGTHGGHHFVDFHYTLHAGTAGLWIVAIAAMAALVALVSGVISHRRIFRDFFTFRPHRGARSWLDAHNAVAVLSLPFQLMIAYTGIVFTATLFLPAGVMTHYGTDAGARVRHAAALSSPVPHARTGRAMAVPDLEPFAARAGQLMGQPVRAVVIDHPGDAGMRIGVYGWNDAPGLERRMSATSGMVAFSPEGEVLHVRQPGGAGDGAASFTSQVMGNLHMAGFGGVSMKWLYFLCGLAGTAMMGTGAVLFMVKRRAARTDGFGAWTPRMHRVIEALNVAAIAGLPIACVAYLWANRLLPLSIGQRADWEQGLFFAGWALALLHALVRSPSRAWRDQLATLAVLCLLLPLANALTAGDHLVAALARGDLESVGVEATCMVLGLLAGWAALRVRPRVAVPARAASGRRAPARLDSPGGVS
jgi:uncharacterized iron-regulated membrane protein